MSSGSWYLYTICLSFLLFTGNRAWAQNPHLTFKQYDVEDGLASSKVYSVVQDSKGYIWFATNNGVSRFNGYEFENFSTSDGLPDNTVFEIFEDHRGRIWFLPLSNMLSYYENGKIVPYKYNHLIKERIRYRATKTSFCVDEKGTVHIGLNPYGICRIDEQGNFTLEKKNLGPVQAMIVTEPKKGCFIYTLAPGLKDGSLIRFRLQQLKGEFILHEQPDILSEVPRVISLPDGKIAFSNNTVLNIVDKRLNVRSISFDYRIIAVYADKDGDLWVGTYLGGVYHIRGTDYKHKACYLAGHSVTAILNDGENGFWITTEGNAVYYTPSKHVLTYDKGSGLPDNRVSCLASGKSLLYAGLQPGFIQQIDTSGKIRLKHTVDKFHNERDLTSIHYQEEQDHLWYSSSKGFGFIGNDGFSLFSFVGVSYSFIFDSAGRHFWTATPDGVWGFTCDGNKIRKRMKKKFKRVNAILRKNDDVLYAGAVDGLWEYRISDSSYFFLGNTHLLLQNRVLHLAYTTDSTLLIATKGAGLLMYSRGIVRRIGVKEGLSSNNVLKLLVEDSVVWAATDRGLNRIGLHKGRLSAGSIRVFTTHDGFVSNEINAVLRFNRKIWLATDKGLSVFDPGDISGLSDNVPLYIRSIFINDSSRMAQNHYELDHSQNNIRIGYIGLSYRNAGNLRYRYRMYGLNDGWNYTQEREIQYTTLPAGTYTFAVSLLDSSGSWTPEKQVSFSIGIPVWKTWWFALFVFILTVCAVFFISRYFLKKAVEKKSREDEINRTLIELKLKALRAQMNPHFIFNVMTSIQHFMLHNDEEAAHRYLSKFSRLIRTILNNSEKNTIPLSEELKALTLYLELECMRFEKQFEYRIDLEGTIDADTMEIPSMLIQPYVENAVKHGILESEKKGHISIIINRQGMFLKCIIEDNGIGRAYAMKHKNSDYRSFGTDITHERLTIINELHHNSLSGTVTDLYDQTGAAAGTRVEILIPYTQRPSG